jgi:GntR family transcriptional regulator / MocR family aminotransferase
MSSLKLLIDIDRASPERLHVQLETQIRAAIRAGRLPAGTRMPTTRALADQLKVSRGVVVESYEQLRAEGYLETRQGDATRVAGAVHVHVPHTDEPALPASAHAPSMRHDFHPGHPDLSRFPRAAWVRSLRGALRSAPHSALGYGDARGASELRHALSQYLGRVRGTVADPECMLISTGHTQALTLVLRTLRNQGAERVVLEDPGFVMHRAIVAHLGLTAVPVPIDEYGVTTDCLLDIHADAIVVTPAHQFPSGVVLAPQRRMALLRWAEREDALIVEDDYDAEYRYDRQPIGALQGLAPERVVYSGTASKTLAPGLRTAWSILPAPLVGPVTGEKALNDYGSDTLAQITLAHFLEHGELDRHLRRMRPHYHQRRIALAEAIERYMPDVRLHGIPAGLHTVVHLPDDADELGLVAAAFDHGISVQGLSSARFDQLQGPPGLILGYANQPPTTIRQGIRVLARVRQALDGPPSVPVEAPEYEPRRAKAPRKAPRNATQSNDATQPNDTKQSNHTKSSRHAGAGRKAHG